jgi:hypothetical protein
MSRDWWYVGFTDSEGDPDDLRHRTTTHGPFDDRWAAQQRKSVGAGSRYWNLVIDEPDLFMAVPKKWQPDTYGWYWLLFIRRRDA